MEEREEMSNRIEAPQSPANFLPMLPMPALLPGINPQVKFFNIMCIGARNALFNFFAADVPF